MVATAAPGRCRPLPGGRICRAVYRRLTIASEGPSMRISGPNANAAVANAPATRRAAPGTFKLNDGEAARASGSAVGLRSVGGIDALIALQGLEDPTERRKQAVRRGRVALDALDELKIGLLGGALARAPLEQTRGGLQLAQ